MKGVRSNAQWTTQYVNQAALQELVGALIQQLAQRFEHVLRRGEEPWRVEGAYMRRIAEALDAFAERLALMTLQRARARAKLAEDTNKKKKKKTNEEDAEKYSVIPQDVLDAYDILKGAGTN